MLKLQVLLAQLGPNELPKASAPNAVFDLSLREVLLVGGAILALASLLFLWAWWTRRNPRRKSETGQRFLYPSSSRSDGKVKIRKKRSRHPDNLPRNPTLAEAGGLPPAREGPAEPA